MRARSPLNVLALAEANMMRKKEPMIQVRASPLLHALPLATPGRLRTEPNQPELCRERL